MATSAHCIPSLLPWQYLGYSSATALRWLLELSTGGQDARPLARLDLYYHTHTERYEWLITPANSFTAYVASRGPGWKHYDKCERAMLLALSAVLHPAAPLPASLPPLGGGIIAPWQGR